MHGTPNTVDWYWALQLTDVVRDELGGAPQGGAVVEYVDSRTCVVDRPLTS